MDDPTGSACGHRSTGARARWAKSRSGTARSGRPDAAEARTECRGLGCHGAGRGRLLYPAGAGSEHGCRRRVRRRTMSRLLTCSATRPSSAGCGRGADHRGHGHRGGVRRSRAPSEAELARRCGFWRVRLAGDGRRSTRPVRYLKIGTLRAGTRRVLVLGGARSGKSERGRAAAGGRAGCDLRGHRNRGADDSGLGGAGGRAPGAAAHLVADGGDHGPGLPAAAAPAGAADRRDRHLAGRGPRRVRLGSAGRRGAGQASRPAGRTGRRVAAGPYAMWSR